MFLADLFIIVNHWKPLKCPSVFDKGDWKSNWCIHTGKKKKRMSYLTLATSIDDPENNYAEWKEPDQKKIACCVIPFIYTLENVSLSMVMGSRSVVTWCGVAGLGGLRRVQVNSWGWWILSWLWWWPHGGICMSKCIKLCTDYTQVILNQFYLKAFKETVNDCCQRPGENNTKHKSLRRSWPSFPPRAPPGSHPHVFRKFPRLPEGVSGPRFYDPSSGKSVELGYFPEYEIV